MHRGESAFPHGEGTAPTRAVRRRPLTLPARTRRHGGVEARRTHGRTRSPGFPAGSSIPAQNRPLSTAAAGGWAGLWRWKAACARRRDWRARRGTCRPPSPLSTERGAAAEASAAPRSPSDREGLRRLGVARNVPGPPCGFDMLILSEHLTGSQSPSSGFSPSGRFTRAGFACNPPSPR